MVVDEKMKLRILRKNVRVCSLMKKDKNKEGGLFSKG